MELTPRKLCICILIFLSTSCSLAPTQIKMAAKQADHAVVFDIDATLTTNNISIYTARNDAAHVVNLYADMGYTIIYLSARNRYFQFNIPDFLERNGFPVGNIHVPQSGADRDDFAAFKLTILKRYLQKGWKLEAAYGDSSTDFIAYNEAGIDKKNIYAIKRSGDKLCQPGPWIKCIHSWSEQLNSITQSVSL